MAAQCLSTFGPCEEVCEVCQKSYDRYVVGERDQQIREAIRVLLANGYIVTSPNPTVPRPYDQGPSAHPSGPSGSDLLRAPGNGAQSGQVL